MVGCSGRAMRHATYDGAHNLEKPMKGLHHGFLDIHVLLSERPLQEWHLDHPPFREWRPEKLILLHTRKRHIGMKYNFHGAQNIAKLAMSTLCLVEACTKTKSASLPAIRAAAAGVVSFSPATSGWAPGCSVCSEAYYTCISTPSPAVSNAVRACFVTVPAVSGSCCTEAEGTADACNE